MLLIGAPPVVPSVKSTVSVPSLAAMPVTVGADGATAVTWKVAAGEVAASIWPLAATVAVIAQVPVPVNCTAPEVGCTEHTDAVLEA